jgi:hypothetical protein
VNKEIRTDLWGMTLILTFAINCSSFQPSFAHLMEIPKAIDRNTAAVDRLALEIQASHECPP